MNALISIDSILEPAAALTPATLFGSGQVETILSAIEKDVRAEAFEVATHGGRERIKSIAYKIARSKTTLDELGKEHVAEIKKQSAAIDAERRVIRDRLDALKDEVRGPLTAWEAAEAARVGDHERTLVMIIEWANIITVDIPIPAIRARIASIATFSGRDWQEFSERAAAAIADAQPKLD
ncbi:hypothetical protein, partial [Bradyrhizobium sp.]|uniref:hypothetical protein n=1 Tax=Bradyrhizobium sp. TaxID=376 RepID=UPI003C3F6A2A